MTSSEVGSYEQVTAPVDESLLQGLLVAPGVSGHERPAQRVLVEWLRGRYEPASDRAGNLWATAGAGREPCVGVAAHCDQVGLIVSSIDEHGFLVVEHVGSLNHSALPASRVTVHTAAGPVPGVIGVQPPHPRAGGVSRRPSRSSVIVDIGASAKEHSGELVRVGDPVTFAQGLWPLDGHVVASPAVDNRVGVYAAFRALDLMPVSPEDGPCASLTAVSTVREETGHVGARVVANRLPVDVMIVVDVIFSGDDPTLRDSPSETDLELGGGPALCRGGGTSDLFVDEMLRVAKESGIPVQIYAAPGESGTDADWFFESGAAVVSLSIPVRYMHSPVETVDLRDVEAAAKLVAAFATNLTVQRWSELSRAGDVCAVPPQDGMKEAARAHSDGSRTPLRSRSAGEL